jgi:hypothetical protein
VEGESLLADHTDIKVLEQAFVQESSLPFGVEAWRTVPPMRSLDVDEDVTVILSPFDHWLQGGFPQDEFSLQLPQTLHFCL